MVKNDGSAYLISPILVWANVWGSPSSLVVIEWPRQLLAESWPIDPLASSNRERSYGFLT